MNLSIPYHLKDTLNVDEKKSSEKILVASLICCENSEFEIQKSQNDFVCIIKAICKECKKEIIIFDNRAYGWEGYVCHLFRDKEASQFQTVICKKDNEKTFAVNLRIRSQGKEDFIQDACQEEVEEAGKKFNEEEWVNAFSEIIINLECVRCKKKINLISFETM